VRSCESRVAARDSLAAALQAALKAERASKPSALRVGVDRALWAAAGLAVGLVVR
jgi:fructose-1-phosphate kinase PfkB-like protein